jgi:hypothetical protein
MTHVHRDTLVATSASAGESDGDAADASLDGGVDADNDNGNGATTSSMKPSSTCLNETSSLIFSQQSAQKPSEKLTNQCPDTH